MTQKIRLQASRFWSALASADTLNAYKNAIDVTIAIFKEGLLLIWLLVCLVLVFFDWGAAKSTAAGQQARNWVEDLKNADSTSLATNAKQTLLLAGKSSVFNTISKARQEIGLPEKEDTPESMQTVQAKATAVAENPTSAKPAAAPESSVATAPGPEATSTDA
ncbi:MAG: hypothetical protein VKL39_03690 [Leptolyngbyaceae bacterium]|nr:hypothetical protein [Leptolyngbyaceae bacterium]